MYNSVVGSLLAASGTGSNANEPEASPILPSGTGSNAYEPEVNPNQPSGTGFNATEPEVLLVLDLHDEACENALPTDLEQPVSEARSISCSIPRKDIPWVRAPLPKNRSP